MFEVKIEGECRYVWWKFLILTIVGYGYMVMLEDKVIVIVIRCFFFDVEVEVLF